MKFRKIGILGAFGVVVATFVSCESVHHAATGGVLGLIHSSNEREIRRLRSEIGDVYFFELRVRVRTSGGVQEVKETIRAEILGHRARAHSVSRQLDLSFEKEGDMYFRNPEGDTLSIRRPHQSALNTIIRSRKSQRTGDFELSQFLYIRSRINGEGLFDTWSLTRENSLEINGFLLEEYRAPVIKIIKADGREIVR